MREALVGGAEGGRLHAQQSGTQSQDPKISVWAETKSQMLNGLSPPDAP